MSDHKTSLRYWAWLVAGAVLVAGIVVLILWGPSLYGFLTNQQNVRAWVEGWGAWGPLAIVLLQIVQVLLAPLPGQPIGAVSGYLYGPWLGTLYPMIGLALGSLILFLLSRRFGRPLAIRLIGKSSMARLDDLVQRGGALFFFLLWLLPFVPDDLACLAAGLTSMPTPQFLVLMLLGRLPGVLVSVWLGANVSKIEPIWWVALFVGAAVGALVLWRWGERIREAILRFIEALSHRAES